MHQKCNFETQQLAEIQSSGRHSDFATPSKDKQNFANSDCIYGSVDSEVFMTSKGTSDSFYDAIVPPIPSAP